MSTTERRQKLLDLLETIRVALLGEPETRWDLIDLRAKVYAELRELA